MACWAGVDALEAEELSVVPGLDEVFAPVDIKGHAQSDEWDVVVVDCAPTAETIRLLSLPDVLARYMERLFPVGRTVNRVVSPLLARSAGCRRPTTRCSPPRSVSTTGWRGRDPDRRPAHYIRLVVNAERLVIAEARRTHTYLSLYGYHVDAVVRTACSRAR